MATFVVTPAITVRPPAPSARAVCAKLALAGIALEHAGGEIRDAEGQELVARLDLVAVQPGERAPDRDRLDERDQRDAGRGGNEPLEVLIGDRRKRRRRQSARHVADDMHRVLEPEDPDQQRRRGDHEQLPRPARAPSAQDEQRNERADADRHGVGVDPVQPLSQPTERRLEGPGGDAADAEEVRELRGDDDQRHRRGESDEHRPREQVGEEPEVQAPTRAA